MIEWKSVFSNKQFKENYIKTVEFSYPEWIPCSVSIFPAVWQKYREELRDIVADHPFLFGTWAKRRKNFDAIPKEHKPNTTWTDNWGCKWKVAQGGYEGQVVEPYPLGDWENFDSYEFPDINKYTERGTRNWLLERIGMWFMRQKKNILATGGGGRLFDRLYFLRGFENLMKDFASENPNLTRLIEKFTTYKLDLVRKWLKMKVDLVTFHTDIGTQDRLMISPSQFRKYIKPMFKEIFQECRNAGAYVYLSSDGYLLDIVDDMVECGVSIHDPQERANTIEGIKKHYKGKICIDLDLDRQFFPFAKPEGIKKQIKTAVQELAMPEGGFMMKAEISDLNVPLENIIAICDALEENCFYN